MIKKFTLLLLAMLCIAGTSKADVEWTLWEGSESFDTSTGGVTDIGSYCRSIQVGDVLTFTVDLGEYEYHQKTLGVKSSTGGWNTTYMANYQAFTDDEISACAYTQEVTEKMYEEIVTNSGMFEVGGKGYTLTKVTAKRSLATCIKTTLAELTTSGSFNGSLLNNAVAGDYIYVVATVSTGKPNGQYKLEGNGVSTQIYNVYDKLLLTLTDDQITAWTSKDCWPYSTLTNLSAANIYLIHPVSSFSIGSIGYATFSAAQQVTAPASVTAYKGEIDGDELVLNPFTNNVIPANTGAIIAGDQGAVLEFTASSAETSETSDLIANTSATDVTSLESGYDYYVLYSGTDESETELPLSTLLGNFGGWHGESTAISWNSSTYTLTYNAAYGNSEGGWCGSDWSGYDKLKLNFSTNTLNNSATFYVAYNGASDSETTSASFDAEAKTVTIPLNATYKNNIGNVSLYSNATSGSLTFESAALIDNDGATVAEFRKLKTTSGTLAANKAYLKIKKGVGGSAPALRVVFGGGTTAIDKVTTEQKAYPEGIFNIYGQRVNQPGKGIYIVNGKKMIFK